jgi:hypothetical protein
MRTIHNGAIVEENDARRLVAHARRNGWLTPTSNIEPAQGR